MNETMNLFIRISMSRMYHHYLPKLVTSIESLDQENVWKHELEQLNSIGGIVIHICEHVNRHVVRYSNSGTTTGGIEDYFPDLNLKPEQLVLQVKGIFEDWKNLMGKYIEGKYDVTKLDMNDIYHLVEHTGYHLGQIVDRTQRVNGTRFQFVQNGINEKNLKEQLGNDFIGG